MAGKTGIGKTGVALAAAVALAMGIVCYIFQPLEIEPIKYGLFLDSPDAWQIDSFLSWLINLGVIALIALLLHLFNRSYNFIRTPEPVLPAVFMVMAASSLWFIQSLNTSSLLCLVNVVCLGIIFDAYESKNATQQMFVLGVAPGLGAMFQYAFLPMACVYVLWALFMKVLRLKEILAFFSGLLCPYWIALGFGWLNFRDFHLPSLVTLFDTNRDYADIIFLLGGIGLAVIIGIIIGLPNFMKLYAGNSKVNAMNLCITALGISSLVCILVDYDNIPAYALSLYMTTAVQIANLCALWNIRREWVVTVLPGMLFIGLFIGNLLL